VAVQGLHAQGKPTVDTITEIDVSNPEAFGKEFARWLRPASKRLAVAS
jgi:hypothetical protein